MMIDSSNCSFVPTARTIAAAKLQVRNLSDFNKKVSRAYGVLHDTWVAFGYKGVSKRAAFVLDGKGILRYKWVTDAPSNEPPYDEVISALGKL